MISKYRDRSSLRNTFRVSRNRIASIQKAKIETIIPTSKPPSLKVEKDVPVPANKAPLGYARGQSKYQFELLEKVGDSILYRFSEFPSISADILYNRLKFGAYEYGRRWNRKLTLEILPEGVRVWRVG